MGRKGGGGKNETMREDRAKNLNRTTKNNKGKMQELEEGEKRWPL
jgi:hypothetical protein